jgi:hypothetical protein
MATSHRAPHARTTLLHFALLPPLVLSAPRRPRPMNACGGSASRAGHRPLPAASPSIPPPLPPGKTAIFIAGPLPHELSVAAGNGPPFVSQTSERGTLAPLALHRKAARTARTLQRPPHAWRRAAGRYTWPSGQARFWTLAPAPRRSRLVPRRLTASCPPGLTTRCRRWARGWVRARTCCQRCPTRT